MTKKLTPGDYTLRSATLQDAALSLYGTLLSKRVLRAGETITITIDPPRNSDEDAQYMTIEVPEIGGSREQTK